MSEFSKYWNIKLNENVDLIKYDNWLGNKNIDDLNGYVLDLGCGNGADTNYLIKKGKKVVSVDFSKTAVARVEKINCGRTLLFDMGVEKEWLKFSDNYFECVVANLSLHYFDDATTKMIFNQIKRILKPNGKFIARVNSIEDVNFGAGEGEELEKGFFRNHERGITKRFFDISSINKYFSIIGTGTIEEKTISFIGKAKKIIEVNFNCKK